MTESLINSETIRRAYVDGVNKKARTLTLPDSINANLAYTPGSASTLYGKQSWPEAIKAQQDQLGVHQLVIDELKGNVDAVTSQDILGLIAKINQQFTQRNIGIQILTSSVGQDNRVHFQVGDKQHVVSDYLSDDVAALHIDNIPTEVLNLNGKAFYCVKKPVEYKSLILLNQAIIESQPLGAAFSMIHELGHSTEVMYGKVRKVKQGKNERDVIALSEYQSTTAALKVGAELYRHTQNQNIIDAVAKQATIYMRVTGVNY